MPKPKDSRLVKENNQYFLKVPYEKEVTFSESQGKCIALDQGLRTFLTGFSETEVFKIGNQCLSKIARLCISMDKLISKMKKEKLHLKKQRMKKALMKIMHADLQTEPYRHIRDGLAGSSLTCAQRRHHIM